MVSYISLSQPPDSLNSAVSDPLPRPAGAESASSCVPAGLNQLPRERVDAPSLELLKAWLNGALGSLI